MLFLNISKLLLLINLIINIGATSEHVLAKAPLDVEFGVVVSRQHFQSNVTANCWLLNPTEEHAAGARGDEQLLHP